MKKKHSYLSKSKFYIFVHVVCTVRLQIIGWVNYQVQFSAFSVLFYSDFKENILNGKCSSFAPLQH